LMRACIEKARSLTRHALVVGGVSMGGLIARYALAEMETQGVEHQTRTLLTIDTPHAGSHTSLAVQWFAQYFASSTPAAALLAALLASPANQQFVTSVLQGGAVGPSAQRAEYLRAFGAVGQYPQKVQRLAVASGAGDGKPVWQPGALMLRWYGSPFASAELRALGAAGQGSLVGSGYSLRASDSTPATLNVSSDQPWECAPGGQNEYNLAAAGIAMGLGYGQVEVLASRVCTVPTISALDLQCGPFEPVPPPSAGLSPFHDYTCCESSQMHLQFTPAVKDWLLDRLGDPRIHH
jgi:Putative serine esterase (DUF676)